MASVEVQVSPDFFDFLKSVDPEPREQAFILKAATCFIHNGVRLVTESPQLRDCPSARVSQIQHYIDLVGADVDHFANGCVLSALQPSRIRITRCRIV